MHEYSVMSYLLETIEAKAREIGAERILTVNLVVGDRSSIVDDAMLFYFNMMTPGTLAQGAALNMERIPSQFYCESCGATFVPGSDFDCPACGRIGTPTEAGSEFYIDSIEVEKNQDERAAS